MEESIITFETAKLAKEIGYMSGGETSYTQYHTNYNYDDDPNHPESHKKDEVRFENRWYHVNSLEKGDFSNENFTIYETPTQSLLQKWLREKHGIDLWIIPVVNGFNKWYEIRAINIEIKISALRFDYYEEALEEALHQALLLIKE